MANVMEQALLLPEDMADLRSMRRHKVFLSLKRNLAMVSPSISLFFFFLNAATFLPLLLPSIFTMFLSSASRSSHIPGRGDNKFLLAVDERRRKAHYGRKGLQCG